MIEEFWDVLSTYDFSNISDINFSWFPPSCVLKWHRLTFPKEKVKDVSKLQLKDSYFYTGDKNTHLKISFSKRNPAGNSD